jgi:hypothetical protein
MRSPPSSGGPFSPPSGTGAALLPPSHPRLGCESPVRKCSPLGRQCSPLGRADLGTLRERPVTLTGGYCSTAKRAETTSPYIFLVCQAHRFDSGERVGRLTPPSACTWAVDGAKIRPGEDPQERRPPRPRERRRHRLVGREARPDDAGGSPAPGTRAGPGPGRGEPQGAAARLQDRRPREVRLRGEEGRRRTPPTAGFGNEEGHPQVDRSPLRGKKLSIPQYGTTRPSRDTRPTPCRGSTRPRSLLSSARPSRRSSTW